MENVVLIIHLLLALSLIGVVLLQRSEGGGLGIGGGGGSMSARRPANPMARVTWGLAIAFIITSIALTVLATRETRSGSVVDNLGATPSENAAPGLSSGESLLPPTSDENAPLVPLAE